MRAVGVGHRPGPINTCRDSSMSIATYSIHGLIRITAEAGVRDSIIKSLDFHIGHFRTDRPEATAPLHVTIRPYDRFQPDAGSPMSAFHRVRGLAGTIVDDPITRAAFRRDPDGYTIWADAGFLITMFIQLLLIERDITLVHAAAVADDSGRVTLLPGPGGVGKTALVGCLVRQHGARLLGDDVVGLSRNGECFSFPRSFVLKEYHREVYPEVFERLRIGDDTRPRTSRTKAAVVGLAKLVRENAPFMGLTKWVLSSLGLYGAFVRHLTAAAVPAEPPFLAAVPIRDIFGAEALMDRGLVDRIVFLERYEGSDFRVMPLSHESLCRRMFGIVHHEWADYMRQFLALGSLELVDLPGYFGRVRAVIEDGTAGRRCSILLIPENASPDELLRHYLSMVRDEP